MWKIKNIVFFLFLGVFLSACGSDRASSSSSNQKNNLGVLGVVIEDNDGDGISNEDEVNIYHTNPDNNDTDGDGLLDGDELKYETNATNADSDGDGLLDGKEIYEYGTNPINPDTDGDGLTDGIEIRTYDTNATNADTDEDGLTDGQEILTYHTNARNADTDADGLNDGAEIHTYDTNATNPDTDGDTLNDGAEVNNYGTNPKNIDSDNDKLEDGVEVNKYDTNASNSDTDGDCLLDGFEVLNYKTNPKNKDTDGDGIEDGIEIYSYGDELITTCKSTPETLANGYNVTPAKDAIPDATNDIINALDPTNDSDGDGQANSKELECDKGNPADKSVMCPYLIDGNLALIMHKHGYAYVPGGFDVDNDGVKEGGFWMSRYQARVKDNGSLIPSETVIEDVKNINKYISKNFEVLNKNIQVANYSEDYLNETTTFAGKELDFSETLAKTKKRITGITPYLALVSLNRTKIADPETGKYLDLNITMPTLKQYLHVKMLLDADIKNGGDGRHIRNGLLGIDTNIPMFSYTLVIDEFGESITGAYTKEYVRNLVQIRDIHGNKSFLISKIPEWWDVNKSKVDLLNSGANATQDLGFGIGPQKDAYGVLVRAGRILDVTQGMSGALSDDSGTTNGISFRAVTDYLY